MRHGLELRCRRQPYRCLALTWKSKVARGLSISRIRKWPPIGVMQQSHAMKWWDLSSSLSMYYYFFFICFPNLPLFLGLSFFFFFLFSSCFPNLRFFFIWNCFPHLPFPYIPRSSYSLSSSLSYLSIFFFFFWQILTDCIDNFSWDYWTHNF